MGWADVLLSSSPSKDQKEQLEIIKESGKSLLTIIGDLLDYSKIEKSRLDFEETAFNIAKTVKSALETNSVLVKSEVKFITDVDFGKYSVVLGDPHRLTQCINNFMSNAAKFTTKGTISFTGKVKSVETVKNDPSTVDLTGSISPRATPTGMLSRSIDTEHQQTDRTITFEFRVRDTGIGIRSDVLKSLFQPFKQAESSTTRRFGGTGLGLAITRALVHSMGGEIIIESTEGVGTEIVWTVKLKETFKNVEASESDGVLAVDTSLKRLKILLADDNEFNQKIICRILNTLSCDVVLANNGQEAINTFVAESPLDLVFMDVQMPVMDGLEAAKIITGINKGRDVSTPIVALTANADWKTAEDCRKVGMVEVLSKPIRLNELKMVLENIRSKKL